MKNCQGNIKKTICIVSEGIFGFPYDTEASIYFSNLAQFFASSGYDISVLIIINSLVLEHNDKINIIKNFCGSINIKLFYLFSANKNDFLYAIKTDNLINSYQVYNWLKTQDEFDFIFFSEYGGVAFYSLLAKHQGLKFERTKIIIKIFHPLRWKLFANKTNFESIDYITDDFIERKSIELADILISSSKYMIDWMKDNRWKIPKEILISQDILYNEESLEKTAANNDKIIERHVINELVYYGNLNTQFGLEIFINSLDILNLRPNFSFNNITITLLISGQKIDDGTIINLQDKANKWHCILNIIDSFDFRQSVKYLLGSSGRLLILPYIIDNTPYILTECFYRKIPFIASNNIASKEYIDDAFLDKFTFSSEKSVLADKIQDSLSNGLITYTSFYDCKKAGANLINLIEKSILNRVCISGDFLFNPKVSVCLVHHERPHFLKYAVDSLRKQDYLNFEVILVDDGSRDKETAKYLESLSEEFKEKEWKIVRQENLYPGAARNRAVNESNGSYVVFLDDDDYLKPFALSTFVKASYYSKADLLTCFNEIFNGEFEPNKENITQTYIFTCDIASGFFANTFGSVTAFIKKEVFLKIGGFHELKGIGYEDWEIFAKIALKGYKVQVVPEELFYYRILDINKNNVNKSTDPYYNEQKVLNAYVEEFDENMSSAFMYLRNIGKLNYRIYYLNNYIANLK